MAGSLTPLYQTGEVYTDTGTASGTIDAKRDVDFGMYEADYTRPGGTSIKFEFRSATNNEGKNSLSSKTFQTATSKTIPVSKGRYLEWKITLATSDDSITPRVDSFTIWCWKDKFFYNSYDEWNSCEKGTDVVISDKGEVTVNGQDNAIEDYVDAGSDVNWQYWANDDRENIDYYYRTSTQSEGRFALEGKDWKKLTAKTNLLNCNGRYLGWKAILWDDARLIKSIFSYNGNEIQNKTVATISDNNLGKLDIQTSCKDVIHSKYEANQTVKSYILIDDDVVETNLTPIFQWTNVIDEDVPRQNFQYVFQLVAKEDEELMSKVYEYSKSTTTEFNSYQSKDASVKIENNQIKLDDTIGLTGSIVYRITESQYKIFNKFIVVDNNIDDETNNSVKYSIRSSYDNVLWTDWEGVKNRNSLLHKGKYFELKISLSKPFGYVTPTVSEFVIEAWDGENQYVVNEDSSGTTQFDSSVDALLLNDRHYFYRVKAFDGVEFSYWSRTQAIWTHTEEAPDKPIDLLTEGVVNPPQIISFNPDFTWTFVQTGHSQSSARVQVGTSVGVWNMWDSGKQSTTSGIEYSPDNLDRGVTYYWRVRTWNENDVASPYSDESANYKLNQLPTKPNLIDAKD